MKYVITPISHCDLDFRSQAQNPKFRGHGNLLINNVGNVTFAGKRSPYPGSLSYHRSVGPRNFAGFLSLGYGLNAILIIADNWLRRRPSLTLWEFIVIYTEGPKYLQWSEDPRKLFPRLLSNYRQLLGDLDIPFRTTKRDKLLVAVSQLENSLNLSGAPILLGDVIAFHHLDNNTI